MTEKDLFRAIGDVDDSLVAEAQELPRKHVRISGGLVAACLCLVATALAAVILPQSFLNGNAQKPAAQPGPESDDVSILGSPPLGSAGVQLPPSSGSPEAAENRSVPETPYNYSLGPAQSQEVPADFAFTLSWGTEGACSYNSAAGALRNGDSMEAQGELALSQEQRQAAWSILSSLDWDSYPAVYHPGNADTKPTMDLQLSFTANGQTHSVRCIAIGTEFTSPDPAGNAFLQVCQQLIALLQRTDAWQALPEPALTQ